MYYAKNLKVNLRCDFYTFVTISDERLLEYDIDKVIFEERTPYQKVQIVHSKSLGNMLVLDDLQSINFCRYYNFRNCTNISL